MACANCDDYKWVCENHPDKVWGGLSSEPNVCECGAGMPCPMCGGDYPYDMGVRYPEDESGERKKL